ncbi:Vps62-related protein [Hazenella sp. IB182357]|uniref:Vps62-related protein n=1 Tax=Polycladospora coralii TaxID=2771432 RepID=A0A926NB02_9BACL|nr:Vps62-related protein [Polycladospora coralii]MBD1373566.1 Vps62-related protein [Polycladospora coralii]MBS7531939.1 Vps62-related protein [Polycladospora coralii]
MKKLMLCLLSFLVLSVFIPSDAFGSDHTYTSEEKLELIKKYAPRIWFDKNERYFPSSVEWSAPYMERYKPEGSNEYSLRSKQSLKNPGDVLDFFYGDLSSANIYVGWREAGPHTIDLKYMVWYPYNRGKLPANIENLLKFLPSGITPKNMGFGHHVGDWEGIEIRVVNGKATQVKLNYHSWNKKYNWSDFQRVDGDNIVIYSARGSHGSWKDPGNHTYLNLVVDTLQDVTSAGTAWDTWNSVEAYDFDLQEGLSGKPWPAWLSNDNTWTEAGKNPSDALAGGIRKWGNSEDGCNFTGLCVNSGGPHGPDAGSNWTGTFGPPTTALYNVSFRSASQKYLVAESDGGKNVNANRNQVGVWERFNLKRATPAEDTSCIKNGDYVNIETGSGYYLRATDKGSLDARASQPKSWEKFQLINHTDKSSCLASGDQISLKTIHGKYVVGENDGDAHADRSKIGSWEKFIFTIHE